MASLMTFSRSLQMSSIPSLLIALWVTLNVLNGCHGISQAQKTVGVAIRSNEALFNEASARQTVSIHEGDSTKNVSIPLLESSLTVLTHNALSNNKAFCKIKGACRVGDGTVLLPHWMRSYSAHIAKCGLKSVRYQLADTYSNPRETYLRSRNPEVHLSLQDDYRDFDVFGNDAPRAERNLLVTDITPTIVLLDLFRRPETYQQFTNTLCATQSGKPCEMEDTSDLSSLRPLLLVDSRISDTKDYMWPKSLLRLIRNSVGGNLAITDLSDIYGWKVRSGASCFRSLISTNVNTSELSNDVVLSSNMFFAKNSLSRIPARTSLAETKDRCLIKILILNRYGKRYIESSEKLSEAITAFARKVRALDSRVVIQPEVVFFESSSFHEQVSVMQEANVVVASHGDGNANFLFLRPQSRVFEILPFGFASDLYRNISIAYGSMHSYVWSQPDRDVFLACVRHFNPAASSERQAFENHWEAAATRFNEETVRRNANIRSEYTIPADDDGIHPTLSRLRQCASYQRISVNAKHLAKMVTRAAADQCQVSGDLSFLDT